MGKNFKTVEQARSYLRRSFEITEREYWQQNENRWQFRRFWFFMEMLIILGKSKTNWFRRLFCRWKSSKKHDVKGHSKRHREMMNWMKGYFQTKIVPWLSWTIKMATQVSTSLYIFIVKLYQVEGCQLSTIW